jgi:AcrR family transcriptional regulator
MPVKPKRKYASPRRAGQAAGTREAVIVAARAQFIDAGWQGTTIAGIARAAGVSSETVYAVFGTKQAVLLAVVEHAVRRARPNVPLLDQDGPQAVAAAVDQRTQIGLFATDIAGVLGNVAELIAVVRTAAATDPALQALYASLHEGRRRNLEFVARALLKTGLLRPGLDAPAATATLWRLASPELFLLMTQVEGLSADRYAAWLAGTLEATLLPDD